MPTWKVIVTMMFALVCTSLGFSVIIVPMTEAAGDNWLWWMLGLIAATAAMGFLFAMFLKSADRTFGKK